MPSKVGGGGRGRANRAVIHKAQLSKQTANNYGDHLAVICPR